MSAVLVGRTGLRADLLWHQTVDSRSRGGRNNCFGYAVSINFLDRPCGAPVTNSLWHIAKHAREHLKCRFLGCRWKIVVMHVDCARPHFHVRRLRLSRRSRERSPEASGCRGAEEAATGKRLSARREAAKRIARIVAARARRKIDRFPEFQRH